MANADAAPIGICLRFSMYIEDEQMHKMLEVFFDCNCAVACWVTVLFFRGPQPELLLMPRFLRLSVRPGMVPFPPWAGPEALNVGCRVSRVLG